MKIAAVYARSLAIPFKTSFRHAAAERAVTQTIWVEARAGEHVGYGEGCPREYVTGESVESALVFCASHAPSWQSEIRGLESLVEWANAHSEEIEANPAAWAAVEIALLDVIGRCEHKSVETLLGVPPLAGRFCYSAVLGHAPPAQFAAQLAKYQHAGFAAFKVKLSGDRAGDLAKVEALRVAGIAPNAVRADANNLWPDARTAIDALRALEYRFHALEEPLRARDYAGMAAIAQAFDCRIILDESVTRARDLDNLAAPESRWIVNVRVSKMGGIMRSLAIVEALRRRGIAIVVGAQVGETSVLTRAALTVAAAARDILIAQEGAFGTHLLERDVVDPPLMFGAGGVLDVSANNLGSAGLALSIQAP